MGKPKDGWKDAVSRDTADLFQTWNWKAAARKKRGGWRKATEEAVAQTTG
jgi:hypothetical protein